MSHNELIKLEEIATINFPRELPDSERKTFCNYVARHIPMSELTIRWRQSEAFGDLYNKIEDQVPCDTVKTDFGGTLMAMKSSLDFSLSRKSPFDERGGWFVGLRIDTMPYDRYEEIPAHRRKLIEEFTKAVKDYFTPR